MIIARFCCGNCGYGPFEVDDNCEAPIPRYAVPVCVYDENSEGRPVSDCPKCEDPLPAFEQLLSPTARFIRDELMQ
jgi:hypothetical protein